MNIKSSKQQMRFSGFRAGLKRRRNGCGRAICIQGKGIGAGWGRGGRGGVGGRRRHVPTAYDISAASRQLGVCFRAVGLY